jgi:hypothetical protein
VLLNRSVAFPRTPRSFVASKLLLERFATIILREATWFLAVDLGIRAITGRKRDNNWISFKSTLGIRDSASSKKSAASGFTEARAD